MLGVVLEGEYRNGMLHGHGSMHWPLGQRIDGTWNRGKITQKRYTFADGLSYEEEGWEYCTLPDRRLDSVQFFNQCDEDGRIFTSYILAFPIVGSTTA